MERYRVRFSLAIVVLAAACALLAADKKRPKDNKPPDVEVVSLKIQREERIIALEGVVRNNSPKPMKGLVLYFEFLEFNGRMISRMKTEVSEETLDPGQEAEFLTQTPDQVRAVDIRLEAEDRDGRYLLINKPGPHRIE
jgi:hypothetical protein